MARYWPLGCRQNDCELNGAFPLAAFVRAAATYGSLLDGVADTFDRLNALCELNIIEQVTAASQTTTVQYLWESG